VQSGHQASDRLPEEASFEAVRACPCIDRATFDRIIFDRTTFNRRPWSGGEGPRYFEWPAFDSWGKCRSQPSSVRSGAIFDHWGAGPDC
jgi:hypothetical protein